MAKEIKYPHSVEAEQSILGCILIDSVIAVSVLSEIKEDDFYISAHKKIYNAALKIFKQNKVIDLVTLTDELEKNNTLKSVGDVSYITFLTNFVPSASNYSFYIDIVKRNSTMRKLLAAGSEIIKLTQDANADDALTYAEKIIFDISNKNQKSNLKHVAQTNWDVLETFKQIEKDPKKLRGLKTGFYQLDKTTNGLKSGELIFIAARPGFGKTSLAMNIVSNAALSGSKCAIFSLEMPIEQLSQRLMCSVAHVSLQKAESGKLNKEEWNVLVAANEKINNSALYIDDSSLNTPIEILSKCRRLKAEHGLDLVMIDYLQLMSSGSKKNENRQQEISEISRSLKILAKELSVPVIVLSQLSRAVEQRKDKKPMLSDLRESGSIEQDADIVLFIHRPDMYLDTEIKEDTVLVDLIIAKHRNGPLATIPVYFTPKFTKFSDTNKNANLKSLEGEK